MASWLIPCSPDIYDAMGAFEEFGSVVWHQQCNMQIYDTVYLYVTAPVMEIRCRCSVEAVDLPCDVSQGDDGYVLDEVFCKKSWRRYMELKLEEIYDTPALAYAFLLQNGLTGAIRSQRRASEELERYIRTVTGELPCRP